MCVEKCEQNRDAKVPERLRVASPAKHAGKKIKTSSARVTIAAASAAALQQERQVRERHGARAGDGKQSATTAPRARTASTWGEREASVSSSSAPKKISTQRGASDSCALCAKEKPPGSAHVPRTPYTRAFHSSRPAEISSPQTRGGQARAEQERCAEPYYTSARYICQRRRQDFSAQAAARRAQDRTGLLQSLPRPT